ncbi:hypothetical protein FO519_002695 [Halicephalobus sp. NKZ332]|nr:hypothetical protein FO519_002695 [Halicephalobus sp. NKZ332]
MPASKNLKLSSGNEMPIFGLGTWQSTKEEVIAAVKAAVKDGYRLIDTASVYQNEEFIGEALEELFKEGVVKREDIFITTKAWTTELPPEAQEAALRESLKKLRLDHVDLYLAHMPVAFNADMSEQRKDITVEDIWRGLESLYEKKLTKAIGVSNWSPEQVERAQKIAKVPVHNVQVELHLYFQQHELHEVCKKHNITLTAYAPIGSPGRTNFVLPNGFRPDWRPAPAPLEDKHVTELAKKYNKSPAQILLRHLIQNGIAVIPKSTNEKRIKENNDVWDFELTKEEMNELNNVSQGPRLFVQDFMIGHDEDPFKNERS